MKKNVVATIVVGLAFFLMLPNVVETATTTKPMKGKIVSLDDVFKGKKDLQLTKERAKELLEQGSPLVFFYNKKYYFVQTEGGDFAFKKLADYAHRSAVGIIGKTKTVGGINFIIMSDIQPMD
ncbi:MAG: hypothetical protein FWG85_05665 [Bacteroidetes bacterium]|nr:hypothetical protein [Bacteroidota bacterium]